MSSSWALRSSLSGVDVPSLRDRKSSLKAATAVPPKAEPAAASALQPAQLNFGGAAPDGAAPIDTLRQAIASEEVADTITDFAPPAPAPLEVNPVAELEAQNLSLTEENGRLTAQVADQANALAALKSENYELKDRLEALQAKCEMAEARASVETVATALAEQRYEAALFLHSEKTDKAATKLQAVTRGRQSRQYEEEKADFLSRRLSLLLAST